jgi:RHS repeat-associated protein
MHLSNHLGNVLVTVLDRKLVEGTEGSTATGYRAEVLFASDYYPFGMQMPGREFSQDEYRYGFNGMEKDDEWKGEGNSYDFGARMYDSRIGRWLRVDPKFIQLPSFSKYSFAANSPIMFVDENGEIFRFPETNGGAMSAEEQLFNTYYSIASEEVKTELDIMAASEVAFNISLVSSPGYGGETSYNEDASLQEGATVLNVVIDEGLSQSRQIGAIADELTHGYQFQTGEIGFVKQEGAFEYTTLSYDLYDEAQSQIRFIEAWVEFTKYDGQDIGELPSEQADLALEYIETGEVSMTGMIGYFTQNKRMRKGYYDHFTDKSISRGQPADQGGTNENWQNYINSNASEIDTAIFRREDQKETNVINKEQ